MGCGCAGDAFFDDGTDVSVVASVPPIESAGGIVCLLFDLSIMWECTAHVQPDKHNRVAIERTALSEPARIGPENPSLNDERSIHYLSTTPRWLCDERCFGHGSPPRTGPARIRSEVSTLRLVRIVVGCLLVFKLSFRNSGVLEDDIDSVAQQRERWYMMPFASRSQRPSSQIATIVTIQNTMALRPMSTLMVTIVAIKTIPQIHARTSELLPRSMDQSTYPSRMRG